MKSGIYILEFKDGIKIGKSSNLTTRTHQYKSPWCKPIVQLKLLPCVSYSDVEKLLLKLFSKNVLVGSKEYLTGVSFEEVLEQALRIIQESDGLNTNKNNNFDNLNFFLDKNNSFFSTREFVLASGKSTPSASRTLNMLASKGIITRITKAVWCNKTTKDNFGAVFHLLGAETGYISFESALNYHNLIRTAPDSFQIATTGHSRKLTSPVGNFTFFQLNPKMVMGGVEFVQNTSPYRMATPEKAILDMLYISTRKSRSFRLLPKVIGVINKKKFNKLLNEQVNSPIIKKAILNKIKHLKGKML